MFERYETQDGIFVRAPEEMTIYHAQQMKEAIVLLLEEEDVLQIDLGNVAEIDTSGIQILMLAKRMAQGLGKPMCMTNHSQAVVHAFDLLNLGAYFGDPVVLTACADSEASS